MKRLTEEMIFAKKTKLRSLTDVYHLYMWGMSLEDVSLIQKLPNIKSISLSMNCIETLQQFSHCKNLQELFLRKNKISSLSELYYLSELENLHVLWLSDNPIVLNEHYRVFTIAILPNLTKLDEIDIDEEEREKSSKQFHDLKLYEIYPDNRKQGISKANEVQERILSAIKILMSELNSDSLEKLSNQIQQLIKCKYK